MLKGGTEMGRSKIYEANTLSLSAVNKKIEYVWFILWKMHVRLGTTYSHWNKTTTLCTEIINKETANFSQYHQTKACIKMHSVNKHFNEYKLQKNMKSIKRCVALLMCRVYKRVCKRAHSAGLAIANKQVQHGHSVRKWLHLKGMKQISGMKIAGFPNRRLHALTLEATMLRRRAGVTHTNASMQDWLLAMLPAMACDFG